MKNIIPIIVLLSLSSCIGVRQQDLDAWVGKPVGALDTHSVFLTFPMVKTITNDGIEIRDYVNKRNVSSCGSSGFGTTNINVFSGQAVSYSNFSSFRNCSSGIVGCDNIFYIKNKKIIEYTPVGQCYTDKAAQPEERYLKLKGIK